MSEANDGSVGDHLAAVGALAQGRHPSSKLLVQLGASWGMGHTTMLFLLSFLVIGFGGINGLDNPIQRPVHFRYFKTKLEIIRLSVMTYIRFLRSLVWAAILA